MDCAILSQFGEEENKAIALVLLGWPGRGSVEEVGLDDLVFA